MRTLLTMLIAASLFFGAVSSASAADVNTRSVDRDTMMTMGKALKLSDGVIPTPAELAAICDDPALALMAVIENNRIRDGIRRFALQALTQYESDERVFSFFEKHVNKVRDRETWKLMVLTFAQTFGERAVESIEPLLDHRRTEMKLTAIEALGMFGGQEGYNLLKNLVSESTSEEVQNAVSRFVW